MATDGTRSDYVMFLGCGVDCLLRLISSFLDIICVLSSSGPKFDTDQITAVRLWKEQQTNRELLFCVSQKSSRSRSPLFLYESIVRICLPFDVTTIGLGTCIGKNNYLAFIMLLLSGLVQVSVLRSAPLCCC